MESLAVESNNTVCNNPKESVKETRKGELSEADERKEDEEIPFDTDEMRKVNISDINGELCLELSRISLAGLQVGCLKKKLLVLDINGLLADIVSHRPDNERADKTIKGRYIFKRPFYLEFLQFCFEKFEVAVWSSRTKKNVGLMLDYLMGDMKNKLLFYWDASDCIQTKHITLENKHKHVLFKDLRKIWEKGYYNESNTLLLDDSPYKALLNPPHTSVFPHPFTYQNKSSDNSLAARGDLREYLAGLANAENIPEYVKEHPFGQEAINSTSESWDFYLPILDSLSSQPEDNVAANLNDHVQSAS